MAGTDFISKKQSDRVDKQFKKVRTLYMKHSFSGLPIENVQVEHDELLRITQLLSICPICMSRPDGPIKDLGIDIGIFCNRCVGDSVYISNIEYQYNLKKMGVTPAQIKAND